LMKEGLTKGGNGHRQRHLENFLLREKAAQHQEKWRRRMGLTGPSWKVRECKEMGGCCGRGCGCCSKPRITFGWEKGRIPIARRSVPAVPSTTV
jgi:hypothetical protein